MALTITTTGSEISTEKFVVTGVSNDPLVTTVLLSVYIDGVTLSHRLEHLPDINTTDTFSFEINSIIKDYFDFQFLALTGVNQTVLQNVLVGIELNEVIGTAVQGASYRDYVVTKNMTQDTFEIEDFDLNDYDCGDTGSSTSKLLTSSPNPLPIGDLTSVHLSCLTTSYTGTTPKQEWVIETYLNSVLVTTVTEDVDVPSRDISGYIASGKYDISNYRVDFNSADGYDEVRIYVRDILTPFTARSETRSYQLNDACERSITLSWYNELGTQDTFTFLGNINRVGKYTDSSFKQVRPVNPLSTNVGDLVYKSSYNYEYDIFSDRMPETSVEWLSKILINKRAAIQTQSTAAVYSGTVATTQLASPITGAQQQGITVDGGNGFMYVVPNVSGDVLKINISTGIITSFSSGVAGGLPKWFSAEVAPNGKIYCIPYYDDNVLVIDPSTDTVANLAVPTSTGFYSKWLTSAITTGGIIYALPLGGGTTNTLKIDTNTDTVTEFSGVTGGYAACGLSSNGFIYGFGNGSQVLKLNPATDTATNFGLTITSVRCHRAYELNGVMYLFSDVDLFKLTVATDAVTSETIGSVGLVQGWGDSVLALDNNFYLPPSTGGIDYLQRYDPIANTATNIATIELDPEWGRVGISSGGIIYGIPNKTNEVLKITLDSTPATSGKYFPILITTEETTLDDKFTPETLFRLKFRLANRRKGLK